MSKRTMQCQSQQKTYNFLLMWSPFSSSVWNQTIVLLEVDPLNWPHTRVLEPSFQVRDDVDPLEFQHLYYVWKEMFIG